MTAQALSRKFPRELFITKVFSVKNHSLLLPFPPLKQLMFLQSVIIQVL